MVLIDHSQAIQTTRQTTTSTSNVDIPSVSIADTFFNTGDKYLIIASGQFDTASIDDQSGVTILHGSTEFDGADQFTEHAPGSNPQKQDYFYFTVWTAVATEGIKMQFRTGGIGTTGADQVVLTAIRLNDLVENTDWHFNENLTDTTLTLTFSTTNNASITFTPPVAGDNWLVLSRFRGTFDISLSNQLESRFTRAGEASFNTSVISQERETLAGLFQIQPNMHVFNLGAVSNTFTQESRIDEENGTDSRTDSAIFAINLAKFSKSSSSVTTTGTVDITTTDFGELVESISITPVNITDVFILGNFVLDNGSTSGGEARLQVDNVDSPATQTSDVYERNNGWDSKDQGDFLHQTIINLSASAHTIDVDASAVSTGTDILNSSLIAFALETAVPTKIFTVNALLKAFNQTETFTIDARFVSKDELTFKFVEVTADQSHTGDNVFADIPGATIPSGFFVTGRKYLILVTTQAVGSNINTNYSVRTLHGSTELNGSEHVFEPNAVATRSQYSYFNVWTAIAGEGIKMQFKTMTPAQTISADQTTLFALEISEDFVEGVDWHSNEILASTVLSQTPSTANNATITFTPPVAGDDWLVMTGGCVDTDALNILYTSRTARSGEAVSTTPSTTQEGEDAPLDLYVQTVFRVFTLGNASNTFEQEAFKSGTQGPNATREYSTVFAINLNRFRSHSFAYTDGTITLDTTDNLATSTQVQTDTLAPLTSGFTWIMGSFVTGGNAFQEIRARMQVDQVDQVPTQTSDNYQQLLGYDPDDENNWAMQTVEDLDTSSHITDIDVTAETGSPSDRTAQFRNIFEVRLEFAGVVVQTETFLVDALLQATQTETFLVDAFLQALNQEETFLVDGILQATFTETFLVDAFLQATQTETFLVDAILKATFTETFLVDAFLQAEQLVDFLVDAFIQAENQKLFIVDAFVKATFTQDFLVDAIVVNRFTETFIVDGRLIVRRTETFLVDGLIQRQNIDKTFLVDAFVQATFTETFLVDAFIQAQDQEETFLVDAFVQKTQTETFLVDAFIQALNQEETFLVDAFLQATFTETFLVDAFVQKTQTETFLVDAFLQQAQTVDFLVDAFIQADQTEMFIVDGLLRDTFDEDFLVDGLLKGLNQEKDFLVDGLIQALNQEEDFLVDGLLEAVNTEDFLVDAQLLKTQTETFLVDAQLLKAQTETFLVDGLTQETIDKDFLVDGRILQTNTEDFLVDGGLAVRKNFQVDARIVRQIQTDVDGILKATQTETFLVDSILKQGNQQFFIVDGLLVVVNSEDFITDAILAEQKTKDFFIDALLQTLNQEEDFLIDAQLAEIKTTTFTVNSILTAIQTETFIVDSMLRLIQIKTFIVDTFIEESPTEPFTVNAILKLFGATKTFIVDTFIEQPTNDKDFIVNAIIIALGDNGNCPTPATQNIYSVASTVFGGTDNMGGAGGQNTRQGLRILAFQAGNTIKDIRWNLSRTVGATGNCFATVRSAGDVIKTTSPAKDVTTITTSTSPPGLVGFTFNEFVTLEEGDRVLIEFSGVETLRLHRSTSGVPGGFERTFFDSSGNYNESTLNAYGSSFSQNIVSAVASNQHACAEVNAILKEFNQEVTTQVDSILIVVVPTTQTETFDVNALLKAFNQEVGFLTDAITFVVPSAITLVNGQLLVTNDEDFFVDAKVIVRNIEDFIVDGQLVAIATNTEGFFVDSLIQALNQEETFIVDGLKIQKDNNKEFTVSAELKPTIDKDFQIDAHVRLISDKDYFVDAQLVAGVPETTTFLVNAIVGFFTEFIVDGSTKATLDADFLVDAIIVRDVITNVDAFIKRLGDNCALGEIFEDNLPNNTGWTVINESGVQIRVDGGFFPKQIQYSAMGVFFSNRLNKLMDQGQGGIVTVDSNKDIRLDFKYKHTGASGDGLGGMVMGITDVNDRIMNNKRFGIRTQQVGGQFQIRLQLTDGIQLRETALLNVPLNQDVFVTAKKIGGSIGLELFTDSSRTIHSAGSPTPLVNALGLQQVIFDHVGGSGNDVISGSIAISGLLDDISVSTRICADFVVDVNLAGATIKEFTVNAIIVRDTDFTVGAFIKALGDVRCQTTFAEKIFTDNLDIKTNWSDEIDSTTVDNWSDQLIFIDGESPLSEELDIFGNTNGFIHASMRPGGFTPAQVPVFKSKYRRKLIGSEGGIGVVQGDRFRLEFELHQTIGGDGAWLGLNKTGFHPENDPNTSSFQVNSGNGRMSATLDDGFNKVTTPDLIWDPAGEESPDPLFIVVESDQGVLKLSAFEDEAHTISNGNSPVSVNSTSVDTDELAMFWLFAGANSKFTPAEDPTPIADIDNILIYSNPCPIARVDAQLKEFFGKDFLVDARLTRQVQTQVDAKLRGRKDFTVNAILSRRELFDINGILFEQPINDFFVSAFLKEFGLAVDFRIDAVISRVKAFDIGAIFSTQPADPNFSENHMLDIVPIFSGLNTVDFLIDGNTAGIKLFTVDAILTPLKTFDVDALLSTEPQLLVFSTTHLQDITQIFGISQPIVEPIVNALIQGFDFEEEFIVDAKLILKQIKEIFVDAQLVSVTKIETSFINALLKAFDQEEDTFVDSRIVSRNITEPIIDGLVKSLLTIVEPDINALLQAFDQGAQYIVNAILIKRQEKELFADAIIKRLGDNGICNVFPEPFTFGTGLELFFQTPITPAHEGGVDLFIGQEFTLNNQQIRKITMLLRASQFPNEIVGAEPSIIQGKIWSNVVKGNPAGEVVVETSENSLDANAVIGDLPAGVWKEITFTFDRATSPFITGTFLVGFEHFVANGVVNPEGVGIAKPVFNNGNVIGGEALFRRSANSGFANPTEWQELLGSEIDMAINVELVNGNEIVDPEGRRCPEMDARVIERNTTDTFVNAIVVIPQTETFDINGIVIFIQEEETIVDARLRVPQTETFIVDGILFDTTIDKDFFVDGNLLLTPLIPVQLDARLFNITDKLKGFTVNAFLQELGVLLPRFADALIQAQDQEETFDVNATLKATFGETPEVDGQLKIFNAEVTTIVTASLAVTQPPVLFTINALLKLEELSFTVEGLISLTRQRETKLDAILSESAEKDFFTNAILEKLGVEEEFIVNSILKQGNQEPFVVNGLVQQQDNDEEYFVDSVLSKASIEGEFTINALLNKSVLFRADSFIQALGDDGNNGSTNPLAVNPFIDQNQTVTGVAVPVGTNLCGQRLRLPTSPVRIIAFDFRMFRDGLSGSPVGTLQGKIYRNSIAGNPISAGDLLDTSDNIVQLSALTTNILGDKVVFNFSTVEITPDDNIFVGIQIIGTNEEVFFNVEGTGTVITGGDFTTESAGNWGVDSGTDANMSITIDDEPRQRGSAIISAKVGIFEKEFVVDGAIRAESVDKDFFVSANLRVRNDTGGALQVNARLIGSVDVIIGAFVGEIQETVLDVESVIRDTNSDFGNESVIGAGGEA